MKGKGKGTGVRIGSWWYKWRCYRAREAGEYFTELLNENNKRERERKKKEKDSTTLFRVEVELKSVRLKTLMNFVYVKVRC